MKNALTFDLEYWWCNEFLKPYLPEKREGLILETLDPVLEILEQYNATATFFVLGSVAEQYPEVLEQISQKGHEIGSHGCSHETLYALGKDKFEDEIRRSIDILSSYGCIGFRAPSFSVNNSTAWCFEILEKYELLYDSSIFPVKTMLYGVPNAPLVKYKPSMEDVAVHDPQGSITEFPLSVLHIGKNIPVAGGFYLRCIPKNILKMCIQHINKSRPAVLYLHPWEMYENIPRLNLPVHYRFEAYHGINTAFSKLEMLLQSFSFQPLREFL